MNLAIRVLDIILSLVGLVMLVPFLPAVWILLRLDSKGPLFYLADRVGKDMKPFKMFKFRTMLDTSVSVGECLCPQLDPRVTTFGRILRRTKINELPQLINILKGEMSFVGPRPESPELAEIYPDEAKIIFSVKPGLVGPASIRGRNEEECYPVGVDVKQYYIEHILSNKFQLDLEYLQRPGIANYLKFLLLGVKETISGVLTKRHITSNQAQIYLLIADLMIITGAYLFSYNFYVWHTTGGLEIVHSSRFLPIVILVRLLCNQYFGLYRPFLRYLSHYDLLKTFKSNNFGTLFLLLISLLLEKHSYSFLIAGIEWVGLNLSSAGLRIALMIYFKQKNRKNLRSQKSRILIFGACDEGNYACRSLISDSSAGYEVVGFIDDAAYNYGKTLNGKKVLGNRHHIQDLAKLYNVDQVVIADARFRIKNIAEIIGLCAEAKLKCGIFSEKNGFNSNNMTASIIRDIEISDILTLKQIKADYVEVKRIVGGKTILINGSGGVLGIELCRRLIKIGCEKLIVVERYESYLNELVSALLSDNLCTCIVPILLEPGSSNMLDEVFSEHRPNIVIQAGLRKFSPLFGFKMNNVEEINYTRNFYLAELAAKYGCKIFVMISSILAKDQSNLIEKSLRFAEVSLEKFFKDTGTRLVIVPICDIAESRGGILSIIEAQVKQRKTINLPVAYDRTMIISKNSAAELILQYLVETKEDLLEGRLFSTTDSPIVMFDIIQKVTALYNLKVSTENQFVGRGF